MIQKPRKKTVKRKSQASIKAAKIRYRFLHPKPKCGRGHPNVDPESRRWDGETWVCLACGVKTLKHEPDDISPEVTMQILELQSQIENEPLAYRKAELRESMRELVLRTRRV